MPRYGGDHVDLHGDSARTATGASRVHTSPQRTRGPESIGLVPIRSGPGVNKIGAVNQASVFELTHSVHSLVLIGWLPTPSLLLYGSAR